jgi:chaperonin cofactor prefoldin
MIRWQSASLLILGIAGLATFGYSLTQQTAIQRQMNETMGQINQSILTTSHVVAQTATVLEPLDATTKALSSIETSEEKTTASLASMNNHLRGIGATEQNIISSLDTLNNVTGQVSSTLTVMQSVGGQLYAVSEASLQQANGMSSRVGDLNHMTDTSISQLHQLNSKLSALRALP